MKTPKLNKSSYFLSFIVLASIIFLSLLAIQRTSPPKPKGLDTPADDFSAARALKHIERIAKSPHMVGTTEKDLVCSYIIAELEKCGVEVDVQSTTIADVDGFPVFANITNIAGRIKGSNNSKAVMVVGHYDTQPHTPGAADDGIAVGSMLEAIKIIKNNYRLKNDIIFLFTDAEEVGMLGAEAFAKEHRWMNDVGFILNLEARGNKGVAVAFEVSNNNGWVIRELAKGVKPAFAGSMMYEIYSLMPNNTDFTVFKNKGYSGINVAIVEGYVNYHSPTDTPENLSLASLQHIGCYIMSTAKHFGNIPLTDTKGDNLVYFNFFGSKIVFFPSYLSVWILVVIALLFFGFIFLGYVRQHLSIGKMLISFFATLTIIAAAIGLVWGLNLLVLKVYPHYNVFYMSNFYNVGYYYLIYTIVAIFIFIVLFSIYLRFVNIFNVMGSIFFIFIALSIYILWKLPTASYLTLLPLFFVLLSVNTLLFFDIDKVKSPWIYHFILLAGLLPLILMISPYIYLIFQIFGLKTPFAGVAFLLVLMLFALPLLETPFYAFRRILSILAIVSVIVLLLIAHIKSKPTADYPLQSNVIYGALPDAEKAYWFSWNLNTDQWNSQFFKDATIGNASEFYPWRKWQQLKAKAEYKNFEKPEIIIVYDSTKVETRVIEFTLKSKLEPVITEIILPVESGVKSFAINGKRVSNLDNYYSKRFGHHLFRLYSPSYGGDKVTVEYSGHDSLSFRLVEVLHGLPKFDFIKPMPASIIPSTDFESSVTVVARLVRVN